MRRMLLLAVCAFMIGGVAPSASAHHEFSGGTCGGDGHRDATVSVPVGSGGSGTTNVGTIGVTVAPGYAAYSMGPRYVEVDGDNRHVNYEAGTPGYGVFLSQSRQCAKANGTGI